MKKLLFIPALSILSIACKPEPSEACATQPDPGPCEAYIPKYYYDTDTKKCTEFIWGGCDGTVPFETIQECEDCLEANEALDS